MEGLLHFHLGLVHDDKLSVFEDLDLVIGQPLLELLNPGEVLAFLLA